jgi:putative spermidine/putrescine transport system permease protein
MKQRWVILLKLSPLIIPFTVIFTTGIFLTFFQSIGLFLPIPVQGGLFSAYRALFQSAWFYHSFAFSFYCAFVSAVCSVVVGTIFSYIVWRLPQYIQQVAILSKIPLILPHVAVAFIVLMFFSKTGYVSSVFYRFGFIDSAEKFPTLLFGGRGFGIIVAYIYKEVPFVILLVSSILKKFDFRRVQTARMLGGSKFMIFSKVVVPFLLPVINTSFIILFLYSFGAFDIPFILGESHPSMLSIQVFNLYFKRDLVNRPSAMAILMVMFVFSLIFIYFYSRISQRIDIKSRKI